MPKNIFLNFFEKNSLTLGELVKLPFGLDGANVVSFVCDYNKYGYYLHDNYTHAQYYSLMLNYMSKLSKLSFTVKGGIDTCIDTCIYKTEPVYSYLYTLCHGASVNVYVSTIYAVPCIYIYSIILT